MKRQLFEFNDTGTVSDTGPSMFGRIRQLRWINRGSDTGSDTGTDLQLDVLPTAADTGEGWAAFINANALNADFTEWNDTGLTATFLAGDRLRVTATKSAAKGTTVNGKVYVWIDDD
jgi:hypothetical protein